MLKAVLFDLDNTLILFDEREFFMRYLPRIARVFSDIMPLDVFRQRLMSSSQAMLQNDGGMSNADFFMTAFCSGLEDRREEIWHRFLRFYKDAFDAFQTMMTEVQGVRDTFVTLEVRGLKRIIASNPFWPRLVQMKRLAWAGLGGLDFDLVTDIENTSFCKPNLGYYREICETMGVPPQACLMVGNDPLNDMVAARIGMKTFLTLDVQDRNGSSLTMSDRLRKGAAIDVIEPDYKGRFVDVLGVVEGLLAE